MNCPHYRTLYCISTSEVTLIKELRFLTNMTIRADWGKMDPLSIYTIISCNSKTGKWQMMQTESQLPIMRCFMMFCCMRFCQSLTSQT